MEADLTKVLTDQWPGWVLLLIASLFALVLVVRFLSLTFESVGRALGPIGKFFRSRRAINHAEADDMRRRIEYLDGRVTTLLYRDQCYFAYVMYDNEYHVKQQLIAQQQGWAIERHVPFLDFRDKWMRERNLDKELDIWR